MIDDEVASSAAIAMTTKPASPSVGRAASAIAVGPYSITFASVGRDPCALLTQSG